MLDVLFVVPSKSRSLTESFSGTLLLSTILKNNNINVGIYHFYETREQKDFSGFIKESAENILSKCPKIVSFYCRCDCYLANILIAKEIKEKAPEVFTVFGGPQTDASAENTMKEIPWVDFCCCGEGETTVTPLFSALINGGDYTNVKGLVYRNAEGSIVQNPKPELIKELDLIPYTDYSFIPKENIELAVKNNINFPVDVGRGCPFNCKYCSTSLFWERRFRIKSPKRIVEEMVRVYNTYSIKYFNFEHDLFTAKKSSVLEFCKELEKTGIDFTWICSSRVDTLDEEMIDAMAKCGCVWVYLGVETGSERMQKIISKNLKISDVKNVCKLLCDRGIYVTASFMYGFPEESEEDIEATLQLVYELYALGVKEFQYHLCAIMPGTPYYNEYADRLSFSESFSDQVEDFGVKESADFVKEHISLFPFYYEYKSEIREKYENLDLFAGDCIIICDLTEKLLPKSFRNKSISQIFFKLRELYTGKEKENNSFSVARNYFSAVLSEELFSKMSAVIDYYGDFQKLSEDKDFSADIKSYKVDINGINKGLGLDEIEARETMVYFARKNGVLSATAINPAAFR